MKYIFILTSIALIIFYIWPEKIINTSKKIDSILVIKHERKMIVYSNNEELKTYKISLGREPEGKKNFEGDQKTPEGVYTIIDKNPNSNFHLNLGISYPNQEDRTNAEKLYKNPGDQIKIHGLKNGFGFI